MELGCLIDLPGWGAAERVATDTGLAITVRHGKVYLRTGPGGVVMEKDDLQGMAEEIYGRLFLGEVEEHDDELLPVWGVSNTTIADACSACKARKVMKE